MIAMALACEPELLIADEPTTALDVTIQAQILDLMRNLRDETGTAIVLITHDLGVVAEMCDRVAVMYAGEIVEQTDVTTLFRDPRHPYTQGLIGSIPVVGEVKDELAVIPGNVPNLIDLPTGCRFAPRCLTRVAENVELAPEHPPAAPPDRTRPRRPLLAVPRSRRPTRGTRSAVTGPPCDASRPSRPVASRAGRTASGRSSRSATSSSTSRSAAGSCSGRRHGPGGRRRLLRDPPRRDARPGRRVGLRQDDRRAAPPAPDRADVRLDPVRRRRAHGAQGRRAQAVPPPDADHLPGPVREPRPADADRRQHRRGPAHPRPRHRHASDARRSAG